MRTVGFLLWPKERRAHFAFARDVSGREMGPLEPLACQWCLMGALLLVASHFRVDLDRVLKLAAHLLGVPCLARAWDEQGGDLWESRLARLRYLPGG